MHPLGRLLRLAGWTAAGAAYVWFAAVGNAHRVRERKAARRRERLARRNVRAG